MHKCSSVSNYIYSLFIQDGMKCKYASFSETF